MARRAGRLRRAFDEGTRANEALTKVDAGLVATGRTLADEIDRAMAEGKGQERTKALYLAPHLVNILREMHATPASRTAVKSAARKPAAKSEGASGDGNGSALGALRGVKGGKTA